MATKPLDPLFLAYSQYRRRKHADCIASCDALLEKHPTDTQAWFLKIRSLTQAAWIDDADLDDVSVADAMLDSHGTAQTPRPGTSLARVGTSHSNANPSDAPTLHPAMRPMSSAGRPLTGFARPGTSSASSSSSSAATALGTARPATSRLMTARPTTSSSGRHIRLGTASLTQTFLDASKLDFARYATRPGLAKALCDYLLTHDHNPRAALALASLATQASDYKDWFWKARLGRCYLLLGLPRDAEKQLKSALKAQDMAALYVDLARVYVRLDQPRAAIDVYRRGFETHHDGHLLLGEARMWAQLGDEAAALGLYKRVLEMDASSVEALACVGQHHYYADAPELAVRVYQRLLLMGVGGAALWNNLALGCTASGQVDLALGCVQRALETVGHVDSSEGSGATSNSGGEEADVWYNVGHVALGIGDVTLAYQAFKVALAADPGHAEAGTNLGVLEVRRGRMDAAKSLFETAVEAAPQGWEARFNLALLLWRAGDYAGAFGQVRAVLNVYPQHPESLELMAMLRGYFVAL